MFDIRIRPALVAAYSSLRSRDDSKENASNIQLLEINSEENPEPGTRTEVDISNTTRLGCLLAIVTTIILAVLCFAYGVHFISTDSGAAVESLSQMASLNISDASFGIPTYFAPISISGAGQEVAVLAFNILITLLNEGMACAHSVSLRWALYKEDRLTYNSPIRLFTSSKTSLPNRWYINILSLFCLILSYAASSVLITNPSTSDTPAPYLVISGTSMVALALAMSGQAAISLWCFAGRQQTIRSWSSNPLNTTLAAIRGGRVSHIQGRCMMSVHQRNISTEGRGTYPSNGQGSIYQAHDSVKWILALLWIMVLLSIGWVITIVVVCWSLAKNEPYGDSSCWKVRFSWMTDQTPCFRNSVSLVMTPAGNIQSPGASTIDYSFAAQTVLALLFTCLIQGSQTIALHCVELFVNITREEALWRRAYTNPTENKKPSSSGTSLSMNPIVSAITSWEYVTLFILKASLHWAMGQSLSAAVTFGYGNYEQISYAFEFNMVYSRLFIYVILATVLACFAAYLVFRRHEGCQPATMGHIQTIANLIDNWDVNEKGQLWWGDATTSSTSYNGGEIVRHAGTSNNRDNLGPIQLGSKYAG